MYGKSASKNDVHKYYGMNDGYYVPQTLQNSLSDDFDSIQRSFNSLEPDYLTPR